MIEYTRAYLQKTAVEETKAVRMGSARPARLIDWRILLNGSGGHSLVVTIHAHDGIRERHVAI